jgi:hypothetical protein
MGLMLVGFLFGAGILKRLERKSMKDMKGMKNYKGQGQTD